MIDETHVPIIVSSDVVLVASDFIELFATFHPSQVPQTKGLVFAVRNHISTVSFG